MFKYDNKFFSNSNELHSFLSEVKGNDQAEKENQDMYFHGVHIETIVASSIMAGMEKMVFPGVAQEYINEYLDPETEKQANNANYKLQNAVYRVINGIFPEKNISYKGLSFLPVFVENAGKARNYERSEKLNHVADYYHNIFIADIIDYCFTCGFASSEYINYIKNTETKKEALQQVLNKLWEIVQGKIDKEETKKLYTEDGYYPKTSLRTDKPEDFREQVKQIIAECESKYKEWQEYLDRKLNKEGVNLGFIFKGIDLTNTFPGYNYNSVDEAFKHNENLLKQISKQILEKIMYTVEDGFHEDNNSREKMPAA